MKKGPLCLKAPREAIEPLVKGKRYVLIQRWNNL
jgi:hypothetical protein